jgi:hypothetical protein
VLVAGATPAPLPFETDRNAGAAKKELPFGSLGNGVVRSIPGFEYVAVEHAVRVTPEAYGTSWEGLRACAGRKILLTSAVVGAVAITPVVVTTIVAATVVVPMIILSTCMMNRTLC